MPWGQHSSKLFGPFVWMEVVKVKYTTTIWNKPGEGRNVLVLSCGHTTSRKTSIPVPSLARCYVCGKPVKEGE